MTSHLLELDSQFNKAFVGVNRADRIYKAALDMRFLRAFQRRINSDPQVADIVQCIKDTEDTYAVCRCFLDKFLNNIVGIMIVSKQVLSTKEHLNWRLKVLLQNIQTLPRIFIEEAKACVKCGAAPCLKSIVADGIKRRKLRKHVRNTHACCYQRLMSVAEDSLGNFDRILCHKRTLSLIKTIIYSYITQYLNYSFKLLYCQ